MEISEKFVDDMNDIESNLAEIFGFQRRKLRIEKYDEQAEFDRYMQIQIEKYKKAFPNITQKQLDEMIKQATPLLQTVIKEEANGLEGAFNRDFPDEVFLVSDKLESEIHAKRVLVHESFHAMIFDYLKGNSAVLKTYANSGYNEKFCKNLLRENKLRPLIKSAFAETFKDGGATVYQGFSFEENFVIYNTLAYMLEQELNTSTPNVSNIRGLIDEYISQVVLVVSKEKANVKVPFKDKKIFFRDYILAVMDDLENNPENKDKLNLVQTDYKREKIELETIPSKIPDIIPVLVDNRLKSYKLKPTNKVDMCKLEKLDSEFCKVVDENKKQTVNTF